MTPRFIFPRSLFAAAVLLGSLAAASAHAENKPRFEGTYEYKTGPHNFTYSHIFIGQATFADYTYTFKGAFYWSGTATVSFHKADAYFFRINGPQSFSILTNGVKRFDGKNRQYSISGHYTYDHTKSPYNVTTLVCNLTIFTEGLPDEHHSNLVFKRQPGT
jgi:hypothetical protein